MIGNLLTTNDTWPVQRQLSWPVDLVGSDTQGRAPACRVDVPIRQTLIDDYH